MSSVTVARAEVKRITDRKQTEAACQTLARALHGQHGVTRARSRTQYVLRTDARYGKAIYVYRFLFFFKKYKCIYLYTNNNIIKQ